MKIAVVSANSVEFYPPLRNFLRDARWKNAQMVCYTTYNTCKTRKKFVCPGVKIIRTKQHSSRIPLLNLADRMWFSLRTLWGLIRQKPDKILYIESNSALPVYWYCRFWNRNAGIFIHYYEYSSPERFAQVKWDRFCHRLETDHLYQVMQWCSHTNAERLKLFCRDWSIPEKKSRVVPNYPPRAWQDIPHPAPAASDRLDVVYVGSLSQRSMFVLEFADFVAHQQGKIQWDIYAYNNDPDTVQAVRDLHCPFIRIFDRGVDYDDLPETLSRYQVGVLLYRAQGENYRLNETNKFFEYLTCGLDVWFSDRIELLLRRVRTDAVPKIVAVDHAALEDFDWRRAADHTALPAVEEKFIAEEANTQLIETLLKDSYGL